MLALAVGALALHVSRMASPVMQQGPEPVQGVGSEPVQSAYARSNAPAVGRVEPTASGVPVPSVPADPPPVLLQGTSLRTWSYRNPAIEQVQVILSSEGRPIEADVELYGGPNNVPVKLRVYVEDGRISPFSAVLETPRYPNTVAIRNIGSMVYPFSAAVLADPSSIVQPSPECLSTRGTIQGDGSLRTYPFDPRVESVEVLLTTDGRPLNARIELLQGPNNNKQIVEVYTEDGLDRPFFCILQMPGAGSVVRVVNTGPMEFPIDAALVPHAINQGLPAGDDGWDKPVIGGMGW